LDRRVGVQPVGLGASPTDSRPRYQLHDLRLRRGRFRSPSSPPEPGRPSLKEDDRAERLELLAERLRSEDGLDRETLAQIEQLTGPKQ
jgi:hypothetical protein